MLLSMGIIGPEDVGRTEEMRDGFVDSSWDGRTRWFLESAFMTVD